jgi:site-specific DNA-methyltransferase (adenine-specific)
MGCGSPIMNSDSAYLRAPSSSQARGISISGAASAVTDPASASDGSRIHQGERRGGDSFLLMLGDCLERMNEIPDGSVDMVMCDLPYGTTACKWDSIIPFEPLWAAYRRACKKNAAIVLTASQPFTSALVMSNPKAFRHEWIWMKNRAANAMTAKYGPMKRHENVLVFADSAPTYNPQLRKGKPYRGYRSAESKIGEHLGCANSVHKDNPDGILQPITQLEFSGERGAHPTQKPVALMEYLIKTYTNEGETVLDNTMGSGTTGVACQNTARNFIGIERDPAYFAIAQQRMGINS